MVSEKNKSANAQRPSLLTRPFLLLCAAMFLGYANQWVITPAIPLYVDDMGGSAFVAGLALLAFSLPSFTVRPFVGRLADRWSAAGVLAVGLMLLAIGSALLLVPVLAMLFVANVIRGVGWAGLNTGGYTVLAMAAPAQRRGEAAGYYTGVTASANIFFPALGLWIVAEHHGFQLAAMLSITFAALGAPIALRLKREHSSAHLWVAAYCNDVSCYIPSGRVLQEGGYEGGGAMIYYGRPGPFDPSVEGRIITTAGRLMRRLGDS